MTRSHFGYIKTFLALTNIQNKNLERHSVTFKFLSDQNAQFYIKHIIYIYIYIIYIYIYKVENIDYLGFKYMYIYIYIYILYNVLSIYTYIYIYII